MSTRTVAAATAGAVLGALFTLLATGQMGLGQTASAAPAAEAPPRYQYQIASVDMTARVLTIGNEARRFSMTASLDEVLSEAAQGGWRLMDVYTVGSFGPFFVFERPVR